MIASAGTFAQTLRAGVSRSLGATTSASADDRAPARKPLSRRAGRVPAVVLGISAALLLFAAPASAAFLPATPPSFGTPGPEAGQLSGPTAVATNDTSHDVYVADPGNARVDQFAQDGTFIRAFGWNVVASGPDQITTGLSDEVQSLTLKATAGTYTLSFEGEPSAAIPFDATAAEVQAALEAIPALGPLPGNVALSGPAAGPYAIEFTAAKAETDVAELTPDPTNLLNGEEPGTATVATTIPGGGALEVCEPANGDACQAGLPGTGPGELQNPVGIAVDNSTGASKEDVYVADSNRILKFGPGGSFLSANNGSSAPGGAFTGLAAIAADGSGDLWSADSATGKVDEFNPSGTYVPGSEFADGYGSTTAIAVDSGATKVYLMNGANHGATEAWDPASPATKPALIDDGGSAFFPPVFGNEFQRGAGLAMDPSNGDLYVEDAGVSPSFEFTAYLIRYDASGKALEHFGGPGTLAAPFGGSQGIAFDPGAAHPGSASGALYAVENPSSDIRIFASPPKVPPTIDSTSATDVTSTSATLRGQVNPNFYDTRAHFEYTTTDFAGCGEAANPACLTTPDTDLGAADTDQALTVHIQGLIPGTTYHYRVIAENAFGGPQAGPEPSLTTTALPVSATDNCPNAAARAAQGATRLPDCRAYEMVSPPDKRGAEVAYPGRQAEGIGSFEGGVAQAATGGNAITFTSNASFADPQANSFINQYIARRGPTSWVTENITAPQASESYSFLGEGGPYKAFASDLSAAFMIAGENPALPGTGPYGALYLRNDTAGTFQSLATSSNVTAEPPPGGFVPIVRGGAVTPDLAHVVFGTEAALVKGGVPGTVGDNISDLNLYEYSRPDGSLQAVNILPGEPVAQPSINVGVPRGPDIHAISDDGSRVIFEDRVYVPATGEEGERIEQALFLRDTNPLSGPDPDAQTTIRLDSLQGGHRSKYNNKARFQYATPDGSTIFFTDTGPLTADSTATGFQAGKDLYRYDLDAPLGQRLTDLTVDHNPADACEAAAPCAEVKGILGASEDGSYLYYVARGALTGNEQNAAGEQARPGEDNLYLWHEDPTTHQAGTEFIAVLSEDDLEGTSSSFGAERALGPAADLSNTGPGGVGSTTRVAAGGRLVFMSDRPLTAYDDAGQDELYLYDAASRALSCLSCNPSGAQPLGPSAIPSASVLAKEVAFHSSQVLASDGTRFFFDSRDALTPADTNGTWDVYEWEGPGSGGCTVQSFAYHSSTAGCISLISDGQSPKESIFVDASADGSDVFFRTFSRLLGQDVDSNADIYDARVDSDFPPPPPTPPACQGDACQSPAGAPEDPTPASSTYSGPGNPKPPAKCKKNQVEKHGNCVAKKSSKKKHHKKNGKKPNKRTAGHNSGGSK